MILHRFLNFSIIVLALWAVAYPCIGLGQIDADLSAGGAVRVGSSTTTCGSSYTGAIRYNSGTNLVQYCNSSAWTNMAISAISIDALTDAKTDYTTDSDMSLGSGAGNALATGGQFNLFMGENAGNANTTGDQNLGVGYLALSSISTNSQSGAVGYKALTDTTAGNNWGFGTSALLKNTSGAANVGVGYLALGNNLTNDYNIALGSQSLLGTTSAYNVGIGQMVGSTGTGQGSTAAGVQALNLATGTGNIALGYLAGDNITTGNSNIIIGYDIDAPSATASNQINIGNLIFATGASGTGTTISSGNVGIGLTNPASMFVVKSPAAETITAGATITADACGTIKKITSAGAVTTNTTDTFSDPTPGGYNGCCMEVFNAGANNITLDRNTKFKTLGSVDITLSAGALTRICSNGNNWYQVVAVMAPS